MLLILLQQRARELGVELRFETEAQPAAAYMDDFDIVVAADGLNSKVRQEFAEYFKPEIDVRKCKFVWLGTHQKFDDAFTFIFEETEHGWVWAHAYQFDDDTATFIVECTEETWQKFGFGDDDAGGVDRDLRAHLQGLSRRPSAHVERRAISAARPGSTSRACCAQRWHHENVVLMGDAAATAHFSIGSGSKLALESAIALADYLHSEPTRSKRRSRNTRTSGASRC